MGLEDLISSGLGSSLVHPEVARCESLLGLLLEGVVFDHGSHEDIVGILSKSSWGHSLVLANNGVSKHLIHTGWEIFFGVVALGIVTLDLNHLDIFVLAGRLLFCFRVGALTDVGNITIFCVDSDGLNLFDGSEAEKSSNSKSIFHFRVIINKFRYILC